VPKKFKFRLEVILTHRKKIEDEKAGELGRATQERLQAEAAVQAVLDQQQAVLARKAELQASGQFYAADLEGYVRYMQSLQAKEAERRRTLEKAREGEEKARQELVIARQEREILDRLKQNQHTAYLKELDAAEMKLIDELATEAYARKAMGIE